MPKDLHTVQLGDGSSALAQEDRLNVVLLKQVANAVGSGAGAAVTVAITGLQLPVNYAVFVGGISQDATSWISGRSQAGFTVNLLPRLAANTLAAGTFDVKVEF